MSSFSGYVGLVHGYGFAGLLIKAAAPSALLGWALGGFNLGVEAGQLIAVSGWLIASQPLIEKPVYDRFVVRAGSWLLFALASFWFLQRAFHLGQGRTTRFQLWHFRCIYLTV
jgi:hypothetical protein